MVAPILLHALFNICLRTNGWVTQLSNRCTCLTPQREYAHVIALMPHHFIITLNLVLVSYQLPIVVMVDL